MNIFKRWQRHHEDLSGGIHHSSHLQRAWSKYGESEFSFNILDITSREMLMNREQFWINTFQAADHAYGFNIKPVAGSNVGHVFSIEARKNMSDAHKWKKQSAETRAKRAAATRGDRSHRALFTNDEVIHIKSRLLMGARGVDITKELGVTKSCISSMRTGYSWAGIGPALPPVKRGGSLHGRAKLTEDAVRDIKARLQAKETVAKIAVDHCVGATTVQDIKQNRTWRFT